MSEVNLAVKKLQRIQQLWLELGRTRLDTPEYQTLMKEIRVLSAEYQTLVDSRNKPNPSGPTKE
jgi:hypothetical protein